MTVNQRLNFYCLAFFFIPKAQSAAKVSQTLPVGTTSLYRHIFCLIFVPKARPLREISNYLMSFNHGKTKKKKAALGIGLALGI